MTYREIYSISVPGLRGKDYTITIEKNEFAGAAKQLVGGEEPLTTSLADDDFMYTPLRFSTGKLNIVGGDEIQKLFATGYQEYRVTVRKDDAVMWCGFIKPELYTQDYSTSTHEISIDLISALSTLEFVKYSQKDGAGLQFVSLKYLLSKAIAAANGSYEAIYFPHTFALSADAYGENALLRDDCVISEQNFFDEENAAMSYKDILEQICRFAHLTLYDNYGKLYFVDFDYTDKYDEYDIESGMLTLKTANAIGGTDVSVQNVKFAGSGHSLDIVGGYNKATIKTSNYCSSDKIFPDEDWENLKALHITESGAKIDYCVNSKFSLGADKVTEVQCKSRCIWVKPSKWEPHFYKGTGTTEDGVKMSTLEVGSHGGYYYNSGTPIYENVEEVTDLTEQWPTSGIRDVVTYYGAKLGRYCNWQLDDDGKATITNYTYENVMFLIKCSMHADEDRGTLAPKHDSVFFNPQKHNGLFNFAGHMPVAAYADGAIAINMQVVPTAQGYGPTVKGVATDGFYYDGEKNTFNAGAKIAFTMVLKIGAKYWNGTTWTDTASTFTLYTDEIKTAGQFVSLATNKTLSQPYNGLTGWLIETGELLTGELYFSILDVDTNCAVKDFSMKYQLKDDFVLSSSDNDRIYTNKVNADYINALDEIEEKISSYNHDGLCFSKVLVNGAFIEDKIYNGITKTLVRPEKLLLQRIVTQYAQPKTLLTQVIMNDDTVIPTNKMTDTYQGDKRFVITGAEKEYRMDNTTIKMLEYDEGD
jgi:hypothetical protein